MDNSIKLNDESIKIYGIKNGENEAIINDYTLNLNTQIAGYGIVAFIADFDYSKISKYDTIKIVYSASLVKDWNLIIGKEGNNNYAVLEYANNPYSKTDYQIQETPRRKVYTYGMTIESASRLLSCSGENGANIELDENGNILYFKKYNDGVYFQTNSDDQDAVTNVSVDKNGHLYLKGLDEGTYNIKQAKAPEGYQISRKIYQMNLSDSNLDGELDEECKLVFKNSKGYILPVTGGIGNKILICIGIILAVIGIIIEISILKKKKILKESK